MMDDVVIKLLRLFLNIFRQASLRSIFSITNVVECCSPFGIFCYSIPFHCTKNSQNDNCHGLAWWLIVILSFSFLAKVPKGAYFLSTFIILSPTSILFTTSIPLTTLANMLYLPSRCGVGQWVMKNCTPSVSFPAEATPIVPVSYV